MNYKLAFALGSIAPGAWGSEVKEPDEQWESVFEGDVTTREISTGVITSNIAIKYSETPVSTVPCKFRISVDGVSTVFEWAVKENSLGYVYEIGNEWLERRVDSVQDTGYDYLYKIEKVYSWSDYSHYFYSRNIGTYAVKLERMVT